MSGGVTDDEALRRLAVGVAWTAQRQNIGIDVDPAETARRLQEAGYFTGFSLQRVVEAAALGQVFRQLGLSIADAAPGVRLRDLQDLLGLPNEWATVPVTFEITTTERDGGETTHYRTINVSVPPNMTVGEIVREAARARDAVMRQESPGFAGRWGQVASVGPVA